MIKRLFITILFCILPCLAFAYNQPLPANQAFHFTAGLGKKSTLLLHWQISPNSYLYKERFHFKVVSPEDVQLKPIEFPPSEQINDKVFGTYLAYENQLTLPLQFTATSNKSIVLKVTYQGCSKLGICYAPVQHVVTVNFAKQYVRIDCNKTLEQLSRQDKIAAMLQGNNIWWVLLIFLGFGLLLAFTPCVLPMIPILSSLVIGQHKRMTTTHAFLLSLVYVLAMSVTYAIAGVIIAVIGGNIQAAFQTPWVIALFVLLFIVLSLSLFGLYEIQLPEKLRSKLMSISNHQHGGTYVGAAMMGIIATLVVSPCVTPPLIGALIFIAKTGEVITGGLALFALGIGMGIPLLVIGTLGGKFLPKSGAWMEGVKKFFGFVMLGMAVYLLSRVIPMAFTLILSGVLFIIAAVFLGEFWQLKSQKMLIKLRRAFAIVLLLYGALLIIGGTQGHDSFLEPLASKPTTETSGAQGVTFIKVSNLNELKAALAKAKGKPVLLDFYADWCVACKEMDATTFQNLNVKNSLSHFVVLRADVTGNTAADKMLAQQFGVVAPPSFVFFDKDGNWLPNQQIVGAMGAKQFDQHLMDILAR